LLVAIVASDTALEMSGRVSASKGWERKGWLMGGAVAMGAGIWSMHFIGMLEFNLPIGLGYEPLMTLLSLAIAITSSAFALWFVCGVRLSGARLAIGGTVRLRDYAMLSALTAPAVRAETDTMHGSMLRAGQPAGMPQ
jgi:NO-binding membrane sensor protein with MHYT domain